MFVSRFREMRITAIAVTAFVTVLTAVNPSRASVITSSRLTTQVEMYYNGQFLTSSYNSDPQTQTIHPLESAVVAALGNDETTIAEADSQATATWTNAASGQLNMKFEWTFNVPSPDTAAVNFGTPPTTPVWIHDFTSDASGTYQLSYSTIATGSDLLGSLPFTVDFNGALLGTADLNTSGTFSAPITAGVPYEVTITAAPNIEGAVGTRTMEEEGTFGWQFTANDPNLATPAPATLTLLASGFFALGGFGLSRRRRRAVRTAC
jgi:hypothetical protein